MSTLRQRQTVATGRRVSCHVPGAEAAVATARVVETEDP
jgi:hypothetical protein